MSQSEVSEILKGRQVMSHDVLVRIAEGLGIPRGLMGLAYDEGVEEVDEEMKRRALFGVASVALFNSPVLGELLQLPKPATPTPLPSRLGASDVTALRNLRSRN
jgi:transcriptional regulator with XRE-family HTH domain